MGFNPWGCKELGTTEWLTLTYFLTYQMFQKLTPIFRILPTHRREGTLLNLFYEVSMVLIDKSNEYHKKTTNQYLFWIYIQRRQWHPTPVLLPGKSHGWRSLVGCNPWGCYESDMTERLCFHFSLSCIGEGNGNPLQYSCLEKPRDGGAWWLLSMGSHRVGHDWSDLA